MSLQMILGPSGSGKSTYIYNSVVKTAAENPKQSYLVIVPDQFTMQTQADFVELSRQGGYMVSAGIMNIDVLSFSRLAHRIFEETGGGKKPVLDDTGKNLILRKCAVDVKDEIPYLSDKLDKAGYIHEIKSAISEFMQYGLDVDAINELAEYALKGKRKTLENKLRCISTIYRRFNEYISENYITTEETMDILATEIYKSRIVENSVVVFDGFTGFTPVQNRVLGALMDRCQQVIVTLTMDGDNLLTKEVNKNELFAFSRKTYDSIKRIAKEHECEILDDYILTSGKRYNSSPKLEFLERHLYRYDGCSYEKESKENIDDIDGINLTACRNIGEEISNAIHNIRYLTHEKNVSYMDIAIITGNLSAYTSEIEEQFKQHSIPTYIDENTVITMNPFVEYIRSVLDMYIYDFSYETVFRFLRTGFAGLTTRQVDILENYVIETGIRGQKAYNRMFTRLTSKMKKAAIEFESRKEKDTDSTKDSPVLVMLEEINDIRVKFMDDLEVFCKNSIDRNSQRKAKDYIEILYSFLVKTGASERLNEYAKMFSDKGEFSKEKEYSQIYSKTMHMFEQIYDLVGDEIMTLDEIYGIIDAGFDELQIGTIPLSVDRVIVGDMERTRLKPIKYLFFLGLNDGWVPKSGGNGGIISDVEREFLVESGKELAPSPRQQLYIDRFYMYLNLTKPSKGLFLSYVAMDSEAKAMRPSYMVEHLEKIFPGLSVDNRITDGINNISSEFEAKRRYAELIRRYSEGLENGELKGDFAKLTRFFSDDREFLDKMISNAFYRYENKSIDRRIAGILYGATMYGSISRMERYAACAYSYFLRYGIGLKIREEYGIDSAKMGNIYHGVLDVFIRKLEENSSDWFSFDDVLAKRLVDEAVEDEATLYTDAVLFENEKNRYVVDRMKDVMLRTVKTIAYQLRSGEYKPVEYEMSFSKVTDLDYINIGLNENERLKITGKIDRLDVNEQSKKVFVKVVDYKSSDKDFSLMSFYKGLQLQMVVYMGAAIESMQKKHPSKSVVPAAMLYYHIDNPIVEGHDGISDEEIEAQIRKALRTKGIVNADSEIILGLDNSGNAKSDVIPVEFLKSGSFSSSSRVMGSEELKLLSDYAGYKLKSIARNILEGDVSLNPIELKSSASQVISDSCAYCDYKHICGFDMHMPGYNKETIMKMEDADIFSAIKDELSAAAE